MILKRVRYGQALTGLIVFAGLVLLVLFFDFVILKSFIPSAAQESLPYTMEHFKWNFSYISLSDSPQIFLKKITLHKEGMMSKQWFYAALLCAYLAGTFFLYILLFVHSSAKNSGGGTAEENTRKKGGKKYKILAILIIWIVIKQAVFVSVTPPWQGPDEIFHFMNIGSYEKNYMDLNLSVRLSCALFEFRKYAEHTYIPYAWLSEEENKRYQPPVYYMISKAVIAITGGYSLIPSLYLSRIVSSMSLMVTSVLTFFIAMRTFTGLKRDEMALLSALFVGSIPQGSFIGATVGGDSMTIMFVTASILCCIISLDPGSDKRKTVVSLCVGIIMVLCAMFTKLTGWSILPVLLITFFLLMFKKYAFPVKKAITYGALVLLPFAGLLSIVAYCNLFDVGHFVQVRVVPATQVFFGQSVDFHGAGEIKRLLTLFISYWLSFGWMVYKMSLGAYLLLGIVTSVILFGLFNNYKKNIVAVNKVSYGILCFYALLVLLFMTRGDPQGRFLYVAISSWAILFSLGMCAMISEEQRERVVKIISGNLLLFNVCSVFGILIPVFYFR